MCYCWSNSFRFILYVWIRIRIRNPDPWTQINPDTDHWKKLYNDNFFPSYSFCLLLNIFYTIKGCILILIRYFWRLAILGASEVTANIYCKSRNLPNTKLQFIYDSLFLRQPVSSFVATSAKKSWYRLFYACKQCMHL